MCPNKYIFFSHADNPPSSLAKVFYRHPWLAKMTIHRKAHITDNACRVVCWYNLNLSWVPPFNTECLSHTPSRNITVTHLSKLDMNSTFKFLTTDKYNGMQGQIVTHEWHAVTSCMCVVEYGLRSCHRKRLIFICL